MVNEIERKKRIVIVGADGALGRYLCSLYAGDATELVRIDLTKQTLEVAAAACGTRPVDILIFADDMNLPQQVSTAERQEMRNALYRLTYAPFRFATLLRSAVAAAKGCVIVYSRTTALMERAEEEGRFADRPFRAAVHALWRCLQVDWQDDDVRFLIIALDNPDNFEKISPQSALPRCEIAEEPGSLIIDANGSKMPW